MARIDDSTGYWIGQNRDKEQEHVSQLSDLTAKAESSIGKGLSQEHKNKYSKDKESDKDKNNYDDSDNNSQSGTATSPHVNTNAHPCSTYARRCHRRAAGLLGRRSQSKSSGVNGLFGALTGILFGDVTLTQESEVGINYANHNGKDKNRRTRERDRASSRDKGSGDFSDLQITASASDNNSTITTNSSSISKISISSVLSKSSHSLSDFSALRQLSFEFDGNSCPRPQSAFYRLTAHSASSKNRRQSMQPGPLTVRALNWRAELVRTSLGTCNHYEEILMFHIPIFHITSRIPVHAIFPTHSIYELPFNCRYALNTSYLSN